MMPTLVNFLDASKRLFLSRMDLLFMWSWTAVVGAFMGSKGQPDLVLTGLCWISMVFITLSVYIYNDIMDIKWDNLNNIIITVS